MKTYLQLTDTEQTKLCSDLSQGTPTPSYSFRRILAKLNPNLEKGVVSETYWIHRTSYKAFLKAVKQDFL